MPSLDDIANLLAIGADSQANANIDLGSLGLGGNDDGIDIPGLSLPPLLVGSSAKSTQASATQTSAQTSAQASATASTNASSSSPQKSSVDSSSGSQTASATSASNTDSSSNSATSNSPSATDSASTAASSETSATDTASATGGAVTQAAETSAADVTSTGTITVSATSGVSDSAVPTSSANPQQKLDTVSTGFMAHKPLYIGIIVVASILGIIFFVVVGTWALRRRRRGKIADFAEELSSDNLVGAGSGFGGGSGSSLGHGSDVEKGVTPAGGWGVDVIEKLEAAGGSRGEAAAFGAGAAMARGPSPTQRNNLPATYGQPDYSQRNINPYGQSPYSQVPGRAPMQNAVYQQQPMVGQLYPQPPPATYASPYAQTQPQRQQQHISPIHTSPAESFTYGSQLPNPFDGAESHVLASQPAPYDLARTPVPVQQFSASPPRNAAPVQRKPPPPFLTLDTAMSPVPGPGSAGSLSGPPMQLANSINSANPPMARVDSPQDMAAKAVSPQKSSLLDGSGKLASAGGSGAGVMQPGHPPVAPALPDVEFGSPTVVNGGSPVTATNPRFLKVVNA